MIFICIKGSWNLLDEHKLVISVFHITKLNGKQINIVFIVHSPTHHKYTRHEVNDNLIFVNKRRYSSVFKFYICNVGILFLDVKCLFAFCCATFQSNMSIGRHFRRFIRVKTISVVKFMWRKKVMKVLH